jgi:PAS domain S-box-containing protein
MHDQALTGVVHVAIDITERKRAKEALEEQFKAMFEMASIGMAQADPKTGQWLRVNRKMCEITGYSPAEMLQMRASEITHPDDRERDWESFQHVVSSRSKNYRLEKRYIRKDGTTVWVNVNMTVIRDFSGQPLRTMATIEDITERRQAEDALISKNRELNDIIEFLPDATFVIDKGRKVIAWNRAIEEMTGVPKEKMIGMGDYAYAVPFYGEPRPLLIDLVMKSINGHIDLYDFIQPQGKLLSGEVLVHKTYGGKGAYLWGTASPLFDMNGNLIGAVEAVRDITELKEIESALLKREADLEEKAHQLEDINTALKVLLRRREEDKKDLEESLLTNVKESILPFLEKLKKSGLDENQKTYLGIVESQLGEIISPFLKRLSSRFTNLTPMEIKVAKLVKDGRTSKEIAEILGVAELTVMTHRNSLRAKLGLRNEKTNLRSHLMSLT